MTGIIVTTPPTVELPPGSTSGGSAVLPGVTYTYAVLSLPQTWTAKQTFPLGNISLQAADVAGLAAVAISGSASDLIGTLPAAQLPNPTATTLGGVKSLTNVAHKWINSIGTNGLPTQTQPDASDVSFTAASGSARTVDARLKDVFFVTDYPGVDPTGATDSAPGFRTAIAAVPYGATLWIPAGTYLLNSYTNSAILDFTSFPNKGITLRGAGWQLKVGSDYTTPSGSILKIGSSIPKTVDFYQISPTQQVSGMGFRDFAVVPAGGAYSQPFGRHGINIDTTAGTTGYVDFLYIDNIFIDNFAAGWGLYVHGQVGGVTLISSIIQNSSFMTTKFINVADNITFSNNVYGANALTYVTSATVGAGGSGGTNGTQTVTVVGGTGTAATLSVTVSGGAITAILSVISGGFYSIFPSNPASVTGASLTGATVNLTQLFPNIGIDASQVAGATNLKIVGCNFVSQDGAVKIVGAQTPIIRDNEIEQNPGNNVSAACIIVTSNSQAIGPVITGNSISNNSSASVTPIFVGAAQGSVILANTIYVPTSGTHGTVSSSATNTRVLYNTCYVNGALVNSGTWSDSGVGTTIIETASVTSFNAKTGAVATSVVVQKFTSNGTYTPTSGMLHAIIECWGGGGGGGGTTTAAATVGIGGGGGGAGGYSRKYVTAADIGVSKTATIGAAGSAGASGNNAGGNGGDTSVGSLCIAKGGSGGGGCAGSGDVTPGAGGIPGTGDISAPGMSGIACPGQAGSHSASGAGASSLVGSGGAAAVSGTAATGNAATGLGAGGSGGQSYNAGGAAAGGAGTAGFVVITEYVNL